MTTGQLMFYSGIAGTLIFIVLLIVSWSVFEAKKKKLIRKIEQELNGNDKRMKS